MLSFNFIFYTLFKVPSEVWDFGCEGNTPEPGVGVSAGGALGRLPYLLEPQFSHL